MQNFDFSKKNTRTREEDRDLLSKTRCLSLKLDIT